MFDGPGSAPLGAAREDAGQWTADWELRARLIFKRTLSPSWSVRRLAAPRSVGPVVSRAYRQPAAHDRRANIVGITVQELVELRRDRHFCATEAV